MTVVRFPRLMRRSFAKLPQVEIVYTKFASLISSDPIVQTMLPLTPAGEICDVDGNCVDPDEDELFKLTTKSGELTLEREKASCLVGRGSLSSVYALAVGGGM